MQMLRNLWFLCDRRARAELALLLVMMLVGAVLEAGGMGIIVPFISAAGRPESLGEYRLVAGLMAATSISDPRRVLIAFGIVAVAANLTKNGYAMGMSYVQYRVLYAHQTRLTHRLFGVYLRSPYAFHLDRHSSLLQRNMSFDARNVVVAVMIPMMSALVEVSIMLAVCCLLLIMDPWATLAAVVMLGTFAGGFYAIVRSRLLVGGQTAQRLNAALMKIVTQGINGIKETKVKGVEGYFLDQYATTAVLYATTQQQMSFIRDMPRAVIESLGFLTVIGMVLMMLLRGDDLDRVLPMIALFAVAGARLMPSFSRIMAALTSVRFSAPSVDVLAEDLRSLEVEPTRPELSHPPIRLVRDICLENVRFKYRASPRPVLDGIDLVIRRGEQIAFVGASGAGKTTVVDVILGLLRLDSGRILIDGVDIQTNLRSWQGQIGYIAQPVYLLDDTVRRNVAYGEPDDRIDDARVWAALAEAQLDEVVRARPNGLDATIGEKGVRLSGGQRQRIGIARALYSAPEVLVLDEATSALDNETEREIMEAIRAFRGKKTILTIAHRLSTVRDSDRLCFLEDGKVVDIGTFDELLDRCDEFRRMVSAAERVQLPAAEVAAP
jgi:ABC-type multidrug transport system fused ATPase/permease subunit